MRKFSTAGLEYLLVPDKAENSSVLDKAENPLVADKDKNLFVPVRIEPDNDENLLFGIPVCTGEYWGMSNPVRARFPQSQKYIGQKLGPNIHWCQKFHFHEFCIQKKIAVRSASVRWVLPRPEIYLA